MEHIHDRELTTEGIAPERRGHLIQVIGVGLNEDGDVGILHSCHGPGLIPEVGEGEDHTAILASMLTQEVGIDLTLARSLHGTIAGGLSVQHQHLVPQRLEHPRQFLSGLSLQRRREEPSVSKEQRESRLLHGGPPLLLSKSGWGPHVRTPATECLDPMPR